VTQESGRKDDPSDNDAREISDASVWFYGRGDLSKVEYYYDPYYDEVYYYDHTYIVYDDGCTGGPDDYDDSEYYDDSDYYDSGGGDYSGDSCDGDVYDDGGSSGSSDWGDSSSSDSSCDYDDTSGDSDSSSSSSGSGDSGWEGDDWAESSSSTSDDDDSDWEGDTWRMRGMSWFAPLGKLAHSHRRVMKLMPLLAGLAVIGLLRRFGRRFTSACGC